MTLAAGLAGADDAVVLTGPDGAPVTAGALRGRQVAGLAPGTTVAVSFADPVALIGALAALDGRAAAMLLVSHALAPGIVARLMAAAGATALVTDRADLEATHPLGPSPAPAAAGGEETRWLMTTSGTTGIPKIVPHTLGSLARSVVRLPAPLAPVWGLPVWGLVYDPTRFAGLQVVLQALLGGGRLAAIDTHAPVPAQVAALAAAGVTHLSATPTLWRRLLMAPGHRELGLVQATLGGEIADQAVLDALRAAYPAARVTHIYASTEAGVGFSVTDGRAGFPRAFLEAGVRGVRLRVEDGILWLKPAVATPPADGIEVDAEGYVRSGDRVQVTGDRLTFLGRESGLINIGGVKVYPEAVEDVIRAVPGVALVQVTGKRSPVTGALVVAAVEPEPGADETALRRAILDACRAGLEREAVPAAVRFVAGFATNAAGKLLRPGAPA